MGLTILAIMNCLGGESNRPLGERCVDVEDCGPNLICTYGRCRSRCTFDRDCPEGTVCIPGDQPGVMVCSLPHEGECPCNPDEICVGDVCVLDVGGGDGGDPCDCGEHLIAGYLLDGNGEDLRSPDHPPFHNGTVTGATDSADGIRGGPVRALVFDLPTARVEIDSLPNPGSRFTWMAWVRAAAADEQPDDGSFPRLLSKGRYHDSEGCALFLLPRGGAAEGHLTFQCFGTNGEEYTHTATPSLFDDQWHHVALTWSDATGALRSFLDGTPLGGHHLPPGVGIEPTTAPFSIGAASDGATWQYGDVVIDEVFLFDIDLSEAALPCVGDLGLTSADL
mgnify:CR=1 FL=1